MTAPAIAESIRIPASTKNEPRSRGLGLLELLGPLGRISLPLASVGIEAKVAGAVADCTLSQTFQNTSAEPLEAEYIFPLPGGAAVRRFELKVAGRTVIGQVRERGQARRDYAVALQQGKRAALLEQERGDVFTVSVGNLPPGEKAEVVISWSERLPMFDDGTAELRLPLVVAPRYIAGNPIGGAAGGGVAEDTDKVPDASRLTPPRLAPGFDPKVSLSLAVHLLRDPAQPLEDLSCSQHAVRQRGGPESIQIELAREGELLDRDFVLRWRMAGAKVQPELLVYQPPEGDAFGVLTLVPPRREGFLGLPRDVVFVLDRSGSMEGQKMIWASRACAMLLRTLGPRDRFSIQAFDDHVEWFELARQQRWVYADEAGLEAGEKFLRGVGARGGTELDLAMREALEITGQRGDTNNGLPVIVLLTDGQIGDESSVLRRLQRELGEARVFTVGIDTAVNAAFLNKLAALGGGTASFVQPGERLEEALRAVGREIGAPLVTDLKVTSGSNALPASALAPALLPDLFAGRPATAFVSMKAIGPLTVTGVQQGHEQGGGTYTATVQPRVVPLPALAQLWAKARVSELEDQYRLSSAGAGGRSPQDLQKEIVDLAVLHTLLTRFTAFIAVDDEIVNPGGQGKKVTQPVQMPQGWEMEKERAEGSGSGGPFQMAARHLPMASMATGAMPVFGGGGMQPPPAPPSPAPAKSSAGLLGGLARGLGAVASSVADAFSDKKDSAPAEEELSMSLDEDAAAPQFPASPPPQPKRLREAKKKGKPSTGAFGRPPPPPPSFAPPMNSPRDGGPGPAVNDADRAALQTALEPVTKALEAIRSELAAGRVPDAAALEKARRDLLALLATSPAASQAGAVQKVLRSGLTELIAALRVAGTPVATLLAMCQARQREWADAKAAFDGAGGPAKSDKPFWGASV
jgi:Ca-activated chloride channel family protein